MSLRASLLHAVADDPAPVPGAVPEPEPAPQEQASTVTRAWRNAGRTWRAGARREGGWINAALRWQGPSAADQQDYLRGRSWVAEGHEGGLADRAGEAYHAGIAIPAVAGLNAAKAAVFRPFTATWVWAVTLFVLFFALRVAGMDSREAALVCGGLLMAPLAYVAVIMLALAARRERQAKKGEKR